MPGLIEWGPVCAFTGVHDSKTDAVLKGLAGRARANFSARQGAAFALVALKERGAGYRHVEQSRGEKRSTHLGHDFEDLVIDSSLLTTLWSGRQSRPSRRSCAQELTCPPRPAPSDILSRPFLDALAHADEPPHDAAHSVSNTYHDQR